MSNFRLEKKFALAISRAISLAISRAISRAISLAISLIRSRICIIIASSFFFCVAFGSSFMVSYGENDSKSNVPTSKYIDNNFFENIKSHEHNVWLDIEAGMSYMKMQKNWNETVSTFGDSSGNTSSTASSQNALQEETVPLSKKNTPNSAEYQTTTITTVVSIDVLKFDPYSFDFSVYSALWDEGNSQTLAEWSVSKNLIAAINASMFLPDGVTSNGYLRKGVLLNNKRQGTRLGGFFVADPKKNQTEDAIILPPVAIIYKDEPDLSRFTSDKNMSVNAVLDKYNVVVQNFRLLEIGDDFENIKLPEQNAHSKAKNSLNNPKAQSKNSHQVKADSQKNTWDSSRRHSIAAIAEDASGNILFLHSQTPITIQIFINIIKNDSSLNLRRALYTEGGGQASMSLTVKDIKKYWPHQNSIFLMLTGKNKLPNIIGVKHK